MYTVHALCRIRMCCDIAIHGTGVYPVILRNNGSFVAVKLPFF